MYKKKNLSVLIIGVIVLCLVLVIALVYAGFTGQLNITGQAVNRQSAWDIHFENLSNITTTGTAKVLSQPSLDGTTTIEDYSVSTTSPGDTISFTFKVVNDGNYNASISSVSVGTPECTGTDTTSNTNVCGKLSYTLTYDNGATVQTGDTLMAKDYVTMKVTLAYAEFNDESLLATAGVSISNLGITINYQQSGNALVNETTGEVANNKVYHQGEKITLNNEDYCLIENSGADQDYVVALRSNILVNIVYGTTSDYDSSNVKTYIDNWVNTNFDNNELKEVEGYKARLGNLSEYRGIYSLTNWECNKNGGLWTKTPGAWSGYVMYCLSANGYTNWEVNGYGNVDPIVNIYKSALETNNNNE